MDNTIQIAERIKQLRKNLGLNQSEFCKKLGIKQSTLSSYENGTVSPSNEVLYAIAKQYHVSLDWLFGISDNEFSLSSMGDIISFLLELNELKELRYELEINDKFFNDIETEDNRWYANIKFYGNEKGHLYNADMCQFLASLNEGQSFEVSAKYSCGFPDPQVSPIIVVDRYLDYFTTIMEDRLWQVLAKPVFRWRNRSGLSMNAARAA